MPYIFRFHAGRNNNIYDWTSSDRIQPADVRDVMDKTNILTSSAGTSIPTPIARMYLFKTAFEIVAAQVRDNQADSKSIYSGLVSETLDLLEMLYKSGSDETKFRYQKWLFDNSQQNDNVILKHFGNDHGHRLLAESFKQAAAQAPFNNKIELTLIYYKEGTKEILVGGTSPFTFVFTSPNFKRKMHDRGFRAISGLVSNDILFDSDYKQLHERDDSFIKYVEALATTQGIGNSFSGFNEYVINTRSRNNNRFNGVIANLQDIQFNDTPLSISNIHLKQLSAADYKMNINLHSDYKIELPDDTNYSDALNPLFLLEKMPYDGQYSSPSSHWSPTTRVSESQYPETTLDEIKDRELPGLDGFNYPFFSSFDFFERCLVKLPGYLLDNERFECLIPNQSFILPIKPIFFHLFPIRKIRDYVSVEEKNGQVTLVMNIPVFGPTKNRRIFTIRKTYSEDSVENPIVNYSGILGIFPFTKCKQSNYNGGYLNKYTVASFEKTNASLLTTSIEFIGERGLKPLTVPSDVRTVYSGINTKSTYFRVGEEFSLIRLNFTNNNSSFGGIIIPKFKLVENGHEDFVYSIDFGTSNTHIEFSPVIDRNATNIKPFEVHDTEMLMTLLNKPVLVEENNGDVKYLDYDKRSLGTIIDSARQITLREFVPFQFGSHKGAQFRFPFRTANFESKTMKDSRDPNIFIHSNIGFNIDNDLSEDSLTYQTDLKWQLESNLTDSLKQNRVALFFRQLLLMIRTHALLQKNPTANLDTLKIAFSFPTSMEQDLEEILVGKLWSEMKTAFNITDDSKRNERLITVTESIAPYYYLLKQDAEIRHDTYCNIDIGGGTSDIVLVKKDSNTLNCYCSSVKFAGKQLWGSASDDFDPDDNGFVKYYKKYLESKDPTLYNDMKMKSLLQGRKIKTEDIVSYLFSNEDLKFKAIFAECKELRIPLLLHYASIIYFVAKICKVRGIELPKTVSFSGKGSEYISLLFTNEEVLKQFTKRALQVFSTLPTNPDFKIKRSAEPKVITAKGSVTYSANPLKKKEVDLFGGGDTGFGNNGELEINPELIYHFGSDDVEFEKSAKTYADFEDGSDFFKRVLQSNKEFLDAIFDTEDLVKGLQSKQGLNIDDIKKFKAFFLKQTSDFDLFRNGVLRNSFKSALEKKKRTTPADDSPFFFAFSTSLIQLSKDIASNAK
jgi:hypothetical protein